MKYLEDLAARRVFGMKPGLETISALMDRLGNPQNSLRAIHIAGTNGKGATAAMLDACLREAGFKVGRYTSPHLVKLNERFFVDGLPLGDDMLEAAAARVADAASPGVTFFEALTAVAFLVFADAGLDYAVVETGLGGRLDATNILRPALSVVTRIGLDHCDWLGETVEKIAGEKAGIFKPGIPAVAGANDNAALGVLREAAGAKHCPFHYAPDEFCDSDIPEPFSLKGAFNRENALTALSALSALGVDIESAAPGFGRTVWPGRFQEIGDFIVDGAHNPPAAQALSRALGSRRLNLVAGFCADKDVDEVLRILSPNIIKAFAVRTSNPRSLGGEELASRMREAGIQAVACGSLAEALSRSHGPTLVCGSLFLAGEALVELGAYPWPDPRFDPEESLRAERKF